MKTLILLFAIQGCTGIPVTTETDSITRPVSLTLPGRVTPARIHARLGTDRVLDFDAMMSDLQSRDARWDACRGEVEAMGEPIAVSDGVRHFVFVRRGFRLVGFRFEMVRT